MECQGDIVPEDVKTENTDNDSDNENKRESIKKDSEKEYSQLGLPVPKPKRGKPKTEKTVEPTETMDNQINESEISESEYKTEIAEGYEETPEGFLMMLDLAKSQVSDIGNFKGMTLGEIYSTNPKHILFLIRNSNLERVREGAISIMKRDPELTRIYNKQ